MKVLLSCLLLALAVGIGNAPEREASSTSCNNATPDPEKAIRALAEPTAPASAAERQPKYDRKQLDRLFAIASENR